MLYLIFVDVIGLRCIMIKYVYRFKIYKFYSILIKKCLNFFGEILIVKVLSGVWIDDIYIGC